MRRTAIVLCAVSGTLLLFVLAIGGARWQGDDEWPTGSQHLGRGRWREALAAVRWNVLAAVDLAGLQKPDRASKRMTRANLLRLVFHAGGGIHGLVLTNSREAVVRAALRGPSLVELDFSWTSDSQLVCVHDWDKTWVRLSNMSTRPTLHEFRTARFADGALTPLTLAGLDTIVRQFPYLRVVSDVKERNLDALAAIAREHPQLARALIPQVYSFREYDFVRALGFESIILTTYRRPYPFWALRRFLSRRPNVILTMPADRLRDYDDGLRVTGVSIYAHTVNSAAEYRSLIAKGVFGVYTDSLGIYTPRP